MARRLATIARFINAHLPGYAARIEKGYCSTDRKIPGTRLRHPGKGRWGNELFVEKDGVEVLRHNAAETYRTNSEVEDWLRREIEKEASHGQDRPDNHGSEAGSVPGEGDL